MQHETGIEPATLESKSEPLVLGKRPFDMRSKNWYYSDRPKSTNPVQPYGWAFNGSQNFLSLSRNVRASSTQTCPFLFGANECTIPKCSGGSGKLYQEKSKKFPRPLWGSGFCLNPSQGFCFDTPANLSPNRLKGFKTFI